MSLSHIIDDVVRNVIVSTMTSPIFTKIVNVPGISHVVDWLLPTAINIQESCKADWIEIPDTDCNTDGKWEELFAYEIFAKAENEITDEKKKEVLFSVTEWGSSHTSHVEYIESMIDHLKCTVTDHLKTIDSRSIYESIDALEDTDEIKVLLEVKLYERECQLML
jgi:hypothetical protein